MLIILCELFLFFPFYVFFPLAFSVDSGGGKGEGGRKRELDWIMFDADVVVGIDMWFMVGSL